MRRAIAFLGCMAALLLPAASARAATIVPLRPCYVSAGRTDAQRQPIDIDAQGFTPNGVATSRWTGR